MSYTTNNINTISNIKTFPIYDGTFLIGNIITIEDITEYDRLQKQVMLSEKLASVGLLAAGVAHEINNPLEIIYTYLSYMKYKFRAQEFHKAIDTLYDQISDITNIDGSKFAQMTFQDTGTGICDENPDNIFLPFYSTKKGQEYNLGLGLSVSYGIIKKYNGTISVENIDNPGCQFIIKSPQSL